MVLRLLKLIGRKLSGKTTPKKDSTSAKTKETDKKKSPGNKKETERKKDSSVHVEKSRDGVSPNYKGSNPRTPVIKYSSGKYQQKENPKQNQSEKSQGSDLPRRPKQVQNTKPAPSAPKEKRSPG